MTRAGHLWTIGYDEIGYDDIGYDGMERADSTTLAATDPQSEGRP
jgi:hypothetical protein